MNIKINLNKGFGIVEALVGITIAALLLVTFTTLIWQTIKINNANAKDLKATMYLQELIEVAKDLEQSDWDELTKDACNISIDSNYKCHPYIDIVLQKWFLSTSGKEYLENNTYTRWLTIENVSRDPATNEIVTSGGVDDPNTKKVKAEIKWNNGFQDRNLTLETYVYNYNP